MMYKQRQKTAQPLDFYLVLDFEATCEKDVDDYPNEIIEFPVIVLNANTMKIENHFFHEYVKPTQNRKLSKFCKELTGITQEVVDTALPLADVLKQFERWLESYNFVGTKRVGSSGSTFAFLTDG
eukprot:TRINITY_DN2503_c0_g1_i1.p1 TRINITY_DN2503_c0_g1~~TRINITY_DN2503_c0_g1_i1.p1  ORF type:complete len:125 (-),score=26.37 TRINITY_DN2503_c0_g1_i1:495-869(-)